MKLDEDIDKRNFYCLTQEKRCMGAGQGKKPCEGCYAVALVEKLGKNRVMDWRGNIVQTIDHLPPVYQGKVMIGGKRMRNRKRRIVALGNWIDQEFFKATDEHKAKYGEDMEVYYYRILVKELRTQMTELGQALDNCAQTDGMFSWHFSNTAPDFSEIVQYDDIMRNYAAAMDERAKIK